VNTDCTLHLLVMRLFGSEINFPRRKVKARGTDRGEGVLYTKEEEGCFIRKERKGARCKVSKHYRSQQTVKERK